jgi:hypothetical protein
MPRHSYEFKREKLLFAIVRRKKEEVNFICCKFFKIKREYMAIN